MYRYFEDARQRTCQSNVVSRYQDLHGGRHFDQGDRMSMATSLEDAYSSRSPVCGMVTGLPIEWKLVADNRNIFSASSPYGSASAGGPGPAKQGFALPLVHWIRNELRELILSVLLEPRLFNGATSIPAL